MKLITTGKNFANASYFSYQNPLIFLPVLTQNLSLIRYTRHSALIYKRDDILDSICF